MPTSIALDRRHVLWSAPEPQRAGRPLIVLMHGWSYDERHLFAFAHRFPGEMVVASVRAPYPEAGGYAWFPSRGNPIGNPQPRSPTTQLRRCLTGWTRCPLRRRPVFWGFPKAARWCCS
jgi:phospholipase/carboxylesterase